MFVRLTYKSYLFSVSNNRNFFMLISRDNICPIDHEPITDDTVHRDRFQEQIIMKMNCYCINRERGCEWQGIVAEAEVIIWTFLCSFYTHHTRKNYRLIERMMTQRRWGVVAYDVSSVEYN